MRKLTASATTFAAILMASGALAQPASDSAATSASDDFGLEAIVVVAQKRAELLSDVPVAVDVMQGSTLDRLNLTTFDQMSRYIPTFNVSEGASGNRITLRGISSGTNRGFEQSVGMFIDGIYAGRAAQFSSPFFDVERIEVLKGPQSILFGKNTIAGAVSIVTAKPTKERSLKMTAGYEFRFKSYDLSAVLNQPITDNLQMRVALYREQRLNGPIYNTLKDTHEPQREANVARVSLAWQPGIVNVNAKYEYSDLSRTGSLFQNIVAGPWESAFKAIDPLFESRLDLQDSVGSPNSDVNRIRSHNASLQVDVPIGNGTLTSDTGYSAYKMVSIGEDADFSPIKIITYDNNESFNQFSQELRYASDADQRLTYIFGAFYQRQHYINRPFYAFTPAILGAPNFNRQAIFDQHADTYSGFLELGYEVVPHLRVIAGGRYIAENKNVNRSMVVLNAVTGLPETNPGILGFAAGPLSTVNYADHQDLRERQFTPAVTLQYKNDDGLMAYAKFSRGFKSGGFDASDGNGTIPPYHSESVSAWEAGVKWDVNARLNLGLTGFYSRFSNLQTQAFNGITFQTTNAGRASTRGVEAEMRWRPLRDLTFAGALTYMKARYDDYANASCTTGQSAAWAAAGNSGTCVQDLSGRPLMDAPEWSGNASVNYLHRFDSDWGVQLNVGANYRSGAFVATDLDPIGWQKRYVTLDASADIMTPSDTFTLSLVGRNLGDARAMTYVVNNPFLSGAKSASINEPRTVELRGTLRF